MAAVQIDVIQSGPCWVARPAAAHRCSKGATLDAVELLPSVHDAPDGHVALCQIAGLVGDQLWCERHNAISTSANCVEKTRSDMQSQRWMSAMGGIVFIFRSGSVSFLQDDGVDLLFNVGVGSISSLWCIL